jgi:hypothetical protein
MVNEKLQAKAHFLQICSRKNYFPAIRLISRQPSKALAIRLISRQPSKALAIRLISRQPSKALAIRLISRQPSKALAIPQIFRLSPQKSPAIPSNFTTIFQSPRSSTQISRLSRLIRGCSPKYLQNCLLYMLIHSQDRM